MKSLFETWGLIDFPESNAVPSFNYRLPVGPARTDEIGSRLSAIAKRREVYDYDTRSISRLESSGKLSGAGDKLYALYGEQPQWLYLYSSDLDWGLVMLNDEPATLICNDTIKDAKLSFSEAFTERTTVSANYYNIEIINAWARASGL